MGQATFASYAHQMGVFVMGFEIGFRTHKVRLCGLENVSQRLWVPARAAGSPSSPCFGRSALPVDAVMKTHFKQRHR